MDWRPTATRAALARRAAILDLVRAHFAATGVLEVDTPLIGLAAAGDPALASFRLDLHGSPRYLQTSPEYAMKRLLAAGSGDVYQICKAFRDEEDSPLHRPEFTLVEWYRLGFDHHALMDDVAALVARVLPGLRLARASFATAARPIRISRATPNSPRGPPRSGSARRGPMPRIACCCSTCC